MTRIPIIAGNWKMNVDVAAAATLSKNIVARTTELPTLPPCEIILAPTTLALAKVQETLSPQLGTQTYPQFHLAAQDVHWEANGAFTGKISTSMLKALAISHSLVGHSEQRQYFHETDETIAKKVHQLLKTHLIPILCIGETLAERKAGAGALEEVLQRQLQTVLTALPLTEINLAATLIIAYEPVWAIGTGVSATVAEAEAAHVSVREIISKLTSPQVAAAIRILYGGSVNPTNARELLHAPNIDGALVGGASLQAESFVNIVAALN